MVIVFRGWFVIHETHARLVVRQAAAGCGYNEVRSREDLRRFPCSNRVHKSKCHVKVSHGKDVLKT